jgi:hypothetical protein
MLQVTNTIGFPSIKQPLALEAEALAFGCPENEAEKGDIFMSYLIVKWNRSGNGFLSVVTLRVSRAGVMSRWPTPGTKTCDAVGGAFRPEWREGQSCESGLVVPKTALHM